MLMQPPKRETSKFFSS